MDRLLTQREAADRLRISLETLRHWRYRGKVRSVRLGHKTVRIAESELDRLLSTVELLHPSRPEDLQGRAADPRPTPEPLG